MKPHAINIVADIRSRLSNHWDILSNVGNWKRQILNDLAHGSDELESLKTELKRMKDLYEPDIVKMIANIPYFISVNKLDNNRKYTIEILRIPIGKGLNESEAIEIAQQTCVFLNKGVKNV